LKAPGHLLLAVDEHLALFFADRPAAERPVGEEGGGVRDEEALARGDGVQQNPTVVFDGKVTPVGLDEHLFFVFFSSQRKTRKGMKIIGRRANLEGSLRSTVVFVPPAVAEVDVGPHFRRLAAHETDELSQAGEVRRVLAPVFPRSVAAGFADAENGGRCRGRLPHHAEFGPVLKVVGEVALAPNGEVADADHAAVAEAWVFDPLDLDGAVDAFDLLGVSEDGEAARGLVEKRRAGSLFE
jgi:hypothetical protein